MSQPPPPPPGVPPPTPSGPSPSSRPFDVGDALSYGWTVYWKNVGPMLVFALVIFAVNIAIGAAGSAVDNLSSQIALNLISFVVGIVLAMGLIRASLAVVEGRTPEINMIFVTDGFGSYLAASILVSVGVVLGLVLLIVPGIILAIMWHFFGYVIVENPTIGPIDAMRRSAEITRGYRWQLFGLGVLLLLMNIAGLLLCVVPVIFTYGITAVTVAYAYKVLSGQPTAPA
jgi:uncharacterized membrane protein